MAFRIKTFAPLAGLVLIAAALAGCAGTNESTGGAPLDDDGQPCAVGSGQGGEAGHDSPGSGTGDITTADGGDPTRPTSDPSAVDQCAPVDAGGEGDRASTGLGEPGGGFSTAPE